MNFWITLKDKLIHVIHTWGMCVPGGMHAWGCVPGGMHAQGVHAQAQVSSPHGQTDTCENITFANFVCRW